MKRLLQHGPTAQAERHPSATAVVFKGAAVTYGALEAGSNRVARVLREAGCTRGDRVGLMMPKSPMAIEAMLGVLKADAVYVPIDAAMPAPRVKKILARSEARFVLAAGQAGRLVEELWADPAHRQAVQFGWLDDDLAVAPGVRAAFDRTDVAAASAAPVAGANGPTDAAHILFTSGSTGEPKGVVLTHANVLHFLDWAIPYFGIDASDRNSGHSPLHFDLSTFDIYSTLTAGAELHVPALELNVSPHKMAAFIRDSGLTQWFSVPSLLNYLAKLDVVEDRDFPRLKRLLWAGEVFPTPALIYWMKKLPHVTFTNLYGPTEATIASSYYTVPECPASADEAIPIGRACGGEELSVRDEALQPVPAGEVGELYIQGVGLSPGYWRDPEKTAAAFVSAPARDGDGPGARIYRTGDLARMDGDGLIYYIGRGDSQIKSRGYRIELGEIEATLHTIPGLMESTVVGARTDGFEGTAICCAFVPAAGSEVTSATIRGHLADALPPYMLPHRWLQLEWLPKTGSGKIDRRLVRECFERGEGALPTAASRKVSRLTLSQVSTPGKGRVGAQDRPLEVRLRDLWELVLGVGPIGLDDDFFDLGGDSLLAVEMCSEIETITGTSLTVNSLLEAPTIRQLSARLRGYATSARSPLVPIQSNGSRPGFFCMHAAGGSVLHYVALARQLGQTQPFYALQAAGLDGRRVPDSRIEDMAERFLGEVQAVQPAGPYFLGGYSLGGLIAYEVASRLMAAGHSVPLLVLFDTYNPAFVSSLTGPQRSRYLAFQLRDKTAWHLKRVFRPGGLAHLRQRVDPVLDATVAKFRRTSTEHESATLRALRSVERAHTLAYDQYRPPVYPGRLTVFRAAEREPGVPPDPLLGWDDVAAGGVEAREVPGDHSTMLREPNVRVLAKHLFDCLERSVSRAGALSGLRSAI